MNDKTEISVISSPLPFSNKQVSAKALPGTSIYDMVSAAIPFRLAGAPIDVLAEVNGWLVPQDHWKHVKPKPGTVVNIRVVPAGSSGGKNPLATLLSIAVLIAAPELGAALANVAGFGGVWIGSTLFTSAQVYSAAIGIIGKLLISALAPPPKPSNTGQNIASNPASSPTQFIQGAKNSINPFGVIPVCLGTNRMFPLQAALPFTESVNNKQFVRQLFTYGYGSQLVISSPSIGDSSISDFTNVQMEHKLNGDLNVATSLFPQVELEDDYTVLLQQVDGYTTRTARADSDEAVVDVTFPQGLCSFSATDGSRQSRRVQCQLQFAPSGVSPQVWSPAADSYSPFSGAALVFDHATIRSGFSTGTYTDYVIIDNYTGVISQMNGGTNFSGDPITVPSTATKLAIVTVNSSQDRFTGVITSTATLTDARDPSIFGVAFQNSSSFVPTISGLTVTISTGALLVNELDITANQTNALRKSVRVVFPARGLYDFRIKRISADTATDKIFDKVYLTAIKSITHESPVNLAGINGTAIRIQATDQLNGALDQFNAVVSNVILDYNSGPDTWTKQITSNPASIYRYVLQSPANAKALADSQINLDDIEDWHEHCEAQGYTYNRVIDYATTVAEVLADVAAAGAASPAIVDGLRTIVIDRVIPAISQIVTPRNSWGYTGEMLFPTLPHAFRVQFRNADKGYAQDERIVYDDGYSKSGEVLGTVPATIFEVLELQSCTDSDLAFMTARRHIAAARLRPESHTFYMAVENLTMLRGNRIKMEHDVPIVGVGDGRIKTVTTDGNSPANVTGFTLDDQITIPDNGTYYVRIRKADGTQVYKPLATTPGTFTAFTFAAPFALADGPEIGDLSYVVEAGGELDLVITRIEPGDDLTARILAINYNEAIFTAESASIPAFESKITTLAQLQRPVAPILVSAASDESVMLRQSDGSFLTRAVFTLENDNQGDISTEVQIRESGSTVYYTPNILQLSPQLVVITGLQDGFLYDIAIRYSRSGALMKSLPLELNAYQFVGASTLPGDVQNFTMTISGDTALLKWDANTEIDIDHYTIEYSSAFTGVTWGTAQDLEPIIYENRVSVPFLPGTYLIKAFDIKGNESVNAAQIVTFDPGSTINAVATLTEDPAWSGAMTNVIAVDGALMLQDVDIATGYYYFANTVDLTGVFTSFVSAGLMSGGTYFNDVYDIADVFAESDIFGGGGVDLFGEADIIGMADIFSLGVDSWSVTLEYSITQTDPNSSPAGWGAWTPFIAGNLTFWAIKFRLVLNSLAANVTPLVTGATVTVDMPDRIERGVGLTCDATLGATVTYPVPFKDSPSVQITLINAATDDKIVYSAKDNTGFTFTVYNSTLAANVTRQYDYISSGYGRLTT